MPDDEQSRHDDEELVLPEEDDLEARQRQRQLADLPERANSSPLLRRIVVGGKGEKPKDITGQEQLTETGERRPDGPEPAEKPKPIAPCPPLELPPVELESTPRDVVPDPGNPAPEVGDYDHLPVGGDGSDPVPPRTDMQVVERTPGSQPKVGERSGVVTRSPVAGSVPRKDFRKKKRHKKGVKFSEERWSGGAESALWWWISAGVVCSGFVIGLVVLNLQRMGGGELSKPERNQFDDSIESTPIAEFVEDPAELAVQVDDLIRRFEAGEDLEQILRGGAASAAGLKEWRTRIGKPSSVHLGRERFLNAMAIDGFGFVVLQGTRQDFSPFGFYFVKGGNGLLLDWEASEGFCEVLPAEVPGLTDREPRLMRALVQASNFYTDLYPEDRYQCYTLQHRNPSEYVWAFVERGSITDLRMRDRVIRGDVWGNERRAVVKVRRGVEGSRPNQVEVVEFLQGEWVMPPAKGAGGKKEGRN